MVDVSAKSETVWEAVAQIKLKLRPATLSAVRAGQMAKARAFAGIGLGSCVSPSR